jgi:hypothetical protein
MGVVLSRSRTVLDFLHAEGGEATFAWKPDEGEEPSATHLRRIDIPRQLWNDLGNPMQVTISIEPGDMLNEEVEDDSPKS